MTFETIVLWGLGAFWLGIGLWVVLILASPSPGQGDLPPQKAPPDPWFHRDD